MIFFSAPMTRPSFARGSTPVSKKRNYDHEAWYIASLEAEKKRADSILYAILPAGAVRELKTANEVKPRRHDDVSILFCDLVGFTKNCDANPAEKVAAELQSLMVVLEDIIDRHGMDKIKTIGDAVLATAGRIKHVNYPIRASVACGLGMVRAAREHEPRWDIRVGIHSGSVVAGVIGRGQFLFDLWGDAVNCAARICDKAAPGTVLLSGSSSMRVRSNFRGKSLGEVELKGKGKIELIECQSALN
ncbi:MAG: adenylate/guanylate cyclase domain-containing protein [Alphaproteobacteria bacterium]|nr:adenylate/guanylate cyclase domain-containing protein [Alphaproteobacteria bacterium]